MKNYENRTNKPLMNIVKKDSISGILTIDWK